MTTLQPIFHALGYRTEAQQRNLIKLMAAADAFGALPGVCGTLTDKQAQAILTSVTFKDTIEAANWLHDATQEHMLRRPPGVERYQCEEPEHFRQNRGELLSALHQMGMLKEIKPQAKHYDHVLVLGAVEGEASLRLDKLREMYEDGVRFDKIHLLGSDRPLDPAHEPMAKIAVEGGATCGTEQQMLTARAYEKSDLWPEALQNVRMFSVETLHHPDGRRANTQDTAVSWLKELKKQGGPLKGSVLVISSQSNVAYQDAAVKSVLPPEFTVETVGTRIAEDNVKISVAMDGIARQIDVGFPKLLEALKTQPQTAKTPIISVDPATVKVDAATYQFRAAGDHATGVTGKGRFDADRWDPILHGDPILVHERLDGSLFVADGHHRLDLAKRLNAAGTGPGTISAMVLSEKQGYTPQDVKLVAAYKNIAQMRRGHNDAAAITDAARVFKEAEKLPFDHRKLLPSLKLEGDIKLSYDMRALSDPALELVTRGDVPAQAAAQVATQVEGAAKQEQAMSLISTRLRAVPGHLAKLEQTRAAGAAAGVGIG